MLFQDNTRIQTLILGIFFLLLITTYSSFSHIVTFITTHTNTQYSFIGQLSLIVNNLVYLLGLARAPSIVNFKRQFMIAALCYSFNYALYIFEFREFGGLVVTVIGAIVGGYGASVLWVSQGGFMVKLFKKYAIQENQQGRYLGMLSGFVYANSLTGAVVTTFFLGVFGNQIYFIVLVGLGLTSLAFCHFLLDPLRQDQVQVQLVESQNKQNSSKCSQLVYDANQMFKFYPKMKYIILAIALDGIMLGFVTSNFSNMLPESVRDDLHLGIMLMIHGVGGIIGGYLSGFLSDTIAVPRVGILCFFFIMFTMLFTLLRSFIEFELPIYSYFVSGFWGISLYSLQGWIFVCCAKIYEGKIQSFAIVKQLHTTFFIIFQIYMIVSDQHINQIITVIVLLILSALSGLTCKCLQIQQSKEKHSVLHETDSPPEVIQN